MYNSSLARVMSYCIGIWIVSGAGHAQVGGQPKSDVQPVALVTVEAVAHKYYMDSGEVHPGIVRLAKNASPKPDDEIDFEFCDTKKKSIKMKIKDLKKEGEPCKTIIGSILVGMPGVLYKIEGDYAAIKLPDGDTAIVSMPAQMVSKYKTGDNIFIFQNLGLQGSTEKSVKADFGQLKNWKPGVTSDQPAWGKFDTGHFNKGTYLVLGKSGAGVR